MTTVYYMTMNLANVVTTSEVAQRFGVTRAAVSLWVSAGKLVPVQRIGGAMVFDRADVDAFAEKRAAA